MANDGVHCHWLIMSSYFITALFLILVVNVDMLTTVEQGDEDVMTTTKLTTTIPHVIKVVNNNDKSGLPFTMHDVEKPVSYDLSD
jgi:hypothetical protein